MTRKNRTVADRLKSLEPVPPVAPFTLGGIRDMYASGGGDEVCCTISGYCRTQVFEFPGINFHPDGGEPCHEIYASPSVRACLVSNLVGYFENSGFSRHYAISPSLRHVVCEADERIKSQQKSHTPVYLVIEESNRLTPVEMFNGECNKWSETFVQDGEIVPRLVGGREGHEFITVWDTADGAWPELPNNEPPVNMILAGVRVGQQTPEPIRKYVDQKCLVTEDGRFVVMMRPTMSARASTATPMGASDYRGRATDIRKAIAAMERDMGSPHMAMLFKAMYRDEYEDDAYQRLQYLRLWESLAEAGPRWLGYQGKSIRDDKVIVAGNKTLEELRDYRDDIAHWWTDTIDENFLVDLHRTINELIHCKYF